MFAKDDLEGLQACNLREWKLTQPLEENPWLSLAASRPGIFLAHQTCEFL